jgi:hypothetical protein
LQSLSGTDLEATVMNFIWMQLEWNINQFSIKDNGTGVILVGYTFGNFNTL